MLRNRSLIRREPETDLIRWSPWREFETLRREMDEMFDRLLGWRPTRAEVQPTFEPTLDVYETPEEFLAFITVPGVSEKDVDVQVTANELTVSGERKPLLEGENITPLWVSRFGGHGKFSVHYTFPVEVNAQRAKAVYRNGVLELRVPKAEAAKPKSVKIKVETQ